MTLFKRILFPIFLFITAISGCESLKISKPIIPMIEYEKMLVGRLDADYIGNDNCLSVCHSHDRIKRDFEASTMGAQLSVNSGMPLVNCESCHGPGSLAVEGITAAKVVDDAAKGIETACKYDTLLDLANLPAQAQSLMCMKCHTTNATFNLHDWNAGAHAIGDVSCFDCHNVHQGPDLITSPKDTKEMCLECHQELKAKFLLPSRHPVLEKKLFCTDCHEPHGTTNDGLLREDTVKETCTRCHGEMEGPYLFEHADLNEDCSACHDSHGSINNHLLKIREPFLCMQCHGGHRTSNDPSTGEKKGAYYTRCTDCHSQIHGSDLPSTGGGGTFIN